MATSATTLLKRFSYPKPPGDQMESIIDARGPNSYVSLALGPPMSGGQLITAEDFGLQSLDFVWFMAPTGGAYTVAIVTDPPLDPGDDFTQVRLVWLTGAGAQAAVGTDLSPYSVRLFARGR